MKFEMYGVEFKLELIVTDESTEIIIVDTIEDVTVAGGSIYHNANWNFNLSEYVKEKVHKYVFKDSRNEEIR